jgi:hypothetical protein
MPPAATPIRHDAADTLPLRWLRDYVADAAPRAMFRRDDMRMLPPL